MKVKQQESKYSIDSIIHWESKFYKHFNDYVSKTVRENFNDYLQKQVKLSYGQQDRLISLWKEESIKVVTGNVQYLNGCITEKRSEMADRGNTKEEIE